MLTIKIFEVVYVKHVYYSTRIWDRNLEVNWTLTVFQDVGKSEKIIKHETKEYHKDALEKAKDFLEPESRGHILQRKRKHLLRGKRAHFFHFEGTRFL